MMYSGVNALRLGMPETQPQAMPVDYSGQDVIGGLVQRGVPETAAIGIAGNLYAESRYDPGINEIAPVVPGSRGGWGLAQWTGPRRRQFESFAQERGAPLDDFDTQLDFLTWELNGPERRAAEAIYAAQTPEDAARLTSEMFLRPGIPHLDARIAEAQRLAGGPAGGPVPQTPMPQQNALQRPPEPQIDPVQRAYEAMMRSFQNSSNIGQAFKPMRGGRR